MADVTSQYIGTSKTPIISQNTESIIRHRCTYKMNGTVAYLAIPKPITSSGRFIIYGVKSKGTDVKIGISTNGTSIASELFAFVDGTNAVDLSGLFNSAPLTVSMFDFNNVTNATHLVITSTGATAAGNIVVAFVEYKG